MSDIRRNVVTRRRAIIGGAIAASAMTVGSSLRVAAQAVQSGGGVSGGGTIAAGEGEASFSLFASRFEIAGQTEPMLLGRVQWVETDGISFESTAISAYGTVEEDDLARMIEGTAKLSTGEEVPFSIMLRDVEGPGSGKDELQLTTETATGEAYEVEGTLLSGDIQLLAFEFPG